MSETYVLIIAAVIGVVTGWLADLMTSKRHGAISTIAAVLTGAFLGAFIANTMESEIAGMWTGPAFAAVGAISLLVVMALVRRRA